MQRVLNATAISGFLPGIFAPIIWPFVVVLMQGSWPTWSVYPMAAISVAFFALVFSLPFNFVLGSLVIISLEKFNLNHPLIVGLLGGLTAFFVYMLLATFNDYPPLKQAWPLGGYFSILGVICGVAASHISRTNKALKSDRANRAAP
jgi:hypothetical protein